MNIQCLGADVWANNCPGMFSTRVNSEGRASILLNTQRLMEVMQMAQIAMIGKRVSEGAGYFVRLVFEDWYDEPSKLIVGEWIYGI